MSAPPPHSEAESNGAHTGSLSLLALTALGVVYGDIGTSPLYAMRECFGGSHGIAVTTANVLGVLSLIFWSLMVVITIKYLTMVLRADNRGEGGILALATLINAGREQGSPSWRLIALIGLFGASLLYADGMITPAISVLSAVEGLEVATPVVEPYVEWITIAILIGLFAVQSRGTARVGGIFGPITLIWFLTLGGLGIAQLISEPQVLAAVNPWHAIDFFVDNGGHGFVILGAVFLVVTGGEALYADIGHFGIRPIRWGWYTVVLPGLLLNYFGQGAHLIHYPSGAEHPFFHMAPSWMLYPLVGLATLATVIASQAVITGAFSLTLQAIQLGYSPRLRVDYTSPDQMGQIYVPAVNWTLMIACIGLVLGFHSSSGLAAAYGVAITITMVITTLLLYFFLRHHWNWKRTWALALTLLFLSIDLAFFSANVLKIAHGGWFPLMVGGVVFTLMSTWMAGRLLLRERMRENILPLELFLAEILNDPPTRVPGIGVFLSSNPIGTPAALRHNVAHNKVLHEKLVILTVETKSVPRVPRSERVTVEEICADIYRMNIAYGFMDDPNVPRELRRPNSAGLDFSGDVTYFLGRETLIASPARPGMMVWREKLFVLMSRNSQNAMQFFRLPPEQVFEVGVQVEL